MAISLTKRELEVLALIAKELTTNDISIQLKISASTVESHRRNLLRKAGAKNAVLFGEGGFNKQSKNHHYWRVFKIKRCRNFVS
jgi:DNA-binding NarL/FixJ family response regulator